MCKMSLNDEDTSFECKRLMAGNGSSNSLRTFSTTVNKGLNVNTVPENNLSAKRKLEEDIVLSQEKKRRESNNSSLCVSPWEFRRLKTDLIDSKALIVKLENRIDELHTKNKENVIFFDKEKNEMKLQLECSRNTVKDLEYRLHKVRKRESEYKEELNERIQLHESEILKLNQKLLQTEHENNELKCKLDELKCSSDSSLTQLKNENKDLKEEHQKIKLLFEEKEHLCRNLEERLSVATEAASNIEEKKEELHLLKLKLQELENEKAEYEEARKLTVALSEKVFRLSEIEKELIAKRQEVANLRQSVQNKVMLEESVNSMKLKLCAAEDREKQVPQLKMKLTELEIELEKWKKLAADFSEDTTVESLQTYIQNILDNELTSKIDINNLNTVKNVLESKVSESQCQVENLKDAMQKLESNCQKFKVEVQVLRKKSILVTRERDSYRQQLDLYEKDLTMTGLSSESFNNEMCSQMKERIKTLEDSLQDYRKHVELLENQIKECQKEEETDNASLISKLKEEVRSLEESNKFLSKIRDDLENKLESLLLKGHHLSPDTKVIHFRDNPIALARRKQENEVNTLKAECDSLRERVKLLESGETMDITQKVSENLKTFSSDRIKELEKELDSANLKMQRLKEVYRKTSQEFCDVSYMLLGYRIVLVSNNKLYKLSNMYSTSPSDYLMFQQNKNGDMEMLGTPFAESLSQLVDEHLHKGNSIPAFLAAVTLSLYKALEQSDEDEDEDEGDDEDDNDNEDDQSHEDPPEEIELD